MGDVIFPNNIPNLNQSLFKGVRILEFNNPKNRKIIVSLLAQDHRIPNAYRAFACCSLGILIWNKPFVYMLVSVNPFGYCRRPVSSGSCARGSGRLRSKISHKGRGFFGSSDPFTLRAFIFGANISFLLLGELAGRNFLSFRAHLFKNS